MYTLQKRREEEKSEMSLFCCRVEELSSDDSLAEFEFDLDGRDSHNLMNNSLLQVYRSAGCDMPAATPTGSRGASAMSHSQSSSSDLVLEPATSPSQDCSEMERRAQSPAESRTPLLPDAACVADTCTSPKQVGSGEDTQGHVAVAMDTSPLVLSEAGSGTGMGQCCGVAVEGEVGVMSLGVGEEREGGRGEEEDGGWEGGGSDGRGLVRQREVELSQGRQKSEETMDILLSNSETRQKSKKVTFAPDVVDREGKSLKVPLIL